MNIGQAAATSGVSAKMIRHYEATGVISRAGRSLSGYRVYTESDVHALCFLKRARTLGFSVSEIRKLLLLWRGRRPSAEVKRLAMEHIDELQGKIAEMQEMVSTLAHLARHCHGDERPECPILDALGSKKSSRRKRLSGRE
jgi:MerR family transcriptional regulator, copper efflux regulator